MRRNPERRAALTDAAIDVLAAEGARGLTFRAVDIAAGVPPGTASNYFANRDGLLHQAALQIHQRLGPDPAALSSTMRTPPSRTLVTELLRGVLARISDDRSSYLALLELRLEAARRPELREALTKTIEADLENNVRFHLDSGLPGHRNDVVLLYLAMTGLVIEHLTLPDVIAPYDPAELIATLVERIIPDVD